MLIRPVAALDAKDWERMRQRLWPSAPGEHAGEVAAFFAGDRHDPAEVFLAVDDEGRAIGFAEVSIRSHADGCDSGRIAYLEAGSLTRRVAGGGSALPFSARSKNGVAARAAPSWRPMPNSTTPAASQPTSPWDSARSPASSALERNFEAAPDRFPSDDAGTK
jgi:hypothetical protein